MRLFELIRELSSRSFPFHLDPFEGHASILQNATCSLWKCPATGGTPVAALAFVYRTKSDPDEFLCEIVYRVNEVWQAQNGHFACLASQRWVSDA